MKLDAIGFDADDTLWHSERYYHDAQQAFTALLAAYEVERGTALDTLHKIELANLPTFGYGIKGFTISMVEAAIEATGGQVRAEDIQKVINLGRAMTSHEILLLESGAEALEHLAKDYKLLLITKGDLMDQERKLAASGLAAWFSQVEIVSDKTPQIYAGLLRKHGLDARRFLMVGNSMRSDILPVLALGGYAAHIPYEFTWAHEDGSLPENVDGRFFAIANLGQLPEVVEKIERGD